MDMASMIQRLKEGKKVILEEKKHVRMKIPDHPEQLTKDAIEKWLDGFLKKLKRTTSRDDLDRLILSVERMEFKDEHGREETNAGGWSKLIFWNGKGKIKDHICGTLDWAVTEFQKRILARSPDLKRRKIERSELKRETGKWILDSYLEERLISEGGEAIVFNQSFGELEVAVRVQCFDPALFTEELKEELQFEIHLSEDFEIAQNKYKDSEKAIPFHENVIKNFANIEIFFKNDREKQDCIGWITVIEKCESDLRKQLKENSLKWEERKKITIEIMKGQEYLKSIGINHLDGKPENILLKDGVPKWSDFGIIQVLDAKGKEAYQKMAFLRTGMKYRQACFLQAGTAAFTDVEQLVKDGDNAQTKFPVHVWTLCDWKTAWSLLFKPVEKNEKERIKEELKSFNAEWLTDFPPSIEAIESVSKMISLKDVSSSFVLDSNLTKSKVLANWKAEYTRQVNKNFTNLTENVVDQKETELCVPISVSSLLRWALKNDVKHVDEKEMKKGMKYFSMERVLTCLTMVVYPRSLAGLNLNPKIEEQDFQETDIELLLNRLKFESYLNKSGWDIIDRHSWAKANFDFEKVLLHEKFSFTRPLTVTGAFFNPDGSVFFHQMVLDRLENSEYVVQNTALNHSASQIRIPLDRPYYADEDLMNNCFNYYNHPIYYGPNQEFLKLVNEKLYMRKEVWHLLPQAYSIELKQKKMK